jgi:AsmA protein
VGIAIGGIVLVAVVALPHLVNLDRYRELLAARAGRALGREVTLGALRVSLWGGLGAEAQGIQIAQAPGFGREPFLSADALRIHFQLLSLLRGQVKVSTAVLERPRIRLSHTRDGRWSFDDLVKTHTTAPPPKPPVEAVPGGKVPLLGGLLVSEVAVRNGEITLLDQARSPGITLTLTDLDLRLRQTRVSDPVEVRSRARIGGTGAGRIETSGRISAGDSDGPVLDATVTLRDVEVGPWQALFLGEGGGTRLSGPLSAEIHVRGPVPRAEFVGAVNLKPVTMQVGETFRKAAGEEANLSFEGRREGEGVNLPKLTLTLKEVRVDGSLRVPDLEAPRITFTAASNKVDLDRLLARPAVKGAWHAPEVAWAAPPPAGSKNKGTGPGLTAQGRIRIDDLRYQGLALSAVEGDIRYQYGLVQFSDVRANLLNGRMTARGEMDLRPKTPRINLTTRLESVPTEPLLKALAIGPWTVRSALTFDSTLGFTGFTSPEILGSAAGGGSLLMKDGRLVGYRPLDRLSEVIAPILATQGIRVRLDEFDQVSGHYTLDKGILRTKDLTLTKPEGTVTAVGFLGLLDSSLNFDVVAKLGRTTVEAKVTGTTNQPIVVPKLTRLQRKIEGELDKALPDERGKGLKDLFKGLFGR